MGTPPLATRNENPENRTLDFIQKNPEIPQREIPPHFKLTDERKKVFLESLENTGSILGAARAASPRSKKGRGAYETFRDAMRRDPVWAMQVTEARNRFVGHLESIVSDHCLHGTARPIFQRGAHVGDEIQWDHELMLRLLARNDPSWREHRHETVDGKLDVRQVNATLILDPATVMDLPPDLRDKVIEIAEHIARSQERPPDVSP